MASKIDFSSLTLNSDEARETSQLVFESTYSRPEIKDTHGVQTGVEMDRYIPILGQFGLLGKIDPAGCSVNTEAGQIPVSQKQWTPKLISFRMAHCQADVPNLLKFWKKSRIAAGTWEQVDDEMMAFISDRVIDAMIQNILRVADFADTEASPVGDGTGNQLLTAGTTKTYFNMLNGLWKQIFIDQAGAALIYRHEITENTGITKNAQLTLADNAAYAAFKAMYENIDARAFESGTLVYQVTRSLFNNWIAFLEDKSLSFTLQRTEEGTNRYTFRGIPIVVRNDWDRIIAAYHDLGATYFLPHRAILTDINNIPIGTSDEESLTSFDSFYDKVTKQWYIDAAYKIDMKILLEYAIACAY